MPDSSKLPISERRLHTLIALFTVAAIVGHLILRFAVQAPRSTCEIPLLAALLLGGGPLVIELTVRLLRFEFGSDLLAGISIVTSIVLGEYLAGALVVLMLSGGEALEGYAVRSASYVLEALSNRMPARAHRKTDDHFEDVAIEQIRVGDLLIIFPHEVCPIDGTVVEGHGVMDESYLTGEPYMMSKTPGSTVLSGAINGESALTIRADKLAVDSRYAKIMQVMEISAQQRPRLRRLGDQLGAYYTPIAIAIGLIAWALSGQSIRFLAVMVIATPCPLLIAIPVTIIGSISLAAKRAIVIRDPIVLERIDTCRTVMFDKTGTLTYGKPKLTEQVIDSAFHPGEVLAWAASIERYSKHPLSGAILAAAEQAGIVTHEASEIHERAGKGLWGRVGGKVVRITHRNQLLAEQPELSSRLPDIVGGLECVMLIDGQYAATYRFRDTPRAEGALFVRHLGTRHKINRVLLITGDRESEARYLAEQVGIRDIHFSRSPEEKLEIVRKETALAHTLFVGDGINDAPALMAATVGIAFGSDSDVTVEAAGAVVMDSSLEKIDELLHISRRMRSIALQSALGGMALSVLGMILAAAGYLPPVAGAIAQEIIDVFAVLNALRVAFPPKALIDYDRS